MSLSSHYSILLLPFSEKLFEQMFYSHCLCFLTLQFSFQLTWFWLLSLEFYWNSSCQDYCDLHVTKSNRELCQCPFPSLSIIWCDWPLPVLKYFLSWLPFIHLSDCLFTALLSTKTPSSTGQGWCLTFSLLHPQHLVRCLIDSRLLPGP